MIFNDFCVYRTRDEELLKACDIVVDVGGVYDPDAFRFDHHQKYKEENIYFL